MTPATTQKVRPEHFKNSLVQMGPKGLEFDCEITEQDRECEWLNDSKHLDREGFLEHIRTLRPSTRIVANPVRLISATRLKKLMIRGREVGAVEIGGYGIHKTYSSVWDASDPEGQDVVLVAFDGQEAVGYASMFVGFFWDPSDKEANFSVGVEGVHVQGAHRGKGFGLDLSIAAGYLVRDVYEAVYRAIRSGTKLSASIRADYESEGGEAFTEHLRTVLDVHVDILRDTGNRPSITLSYPEVDAGY